MKDSEKDNPYKTPKSSLLDEIEEKLSKKEYKIYLSITGHPIENSSESMKTFQYCYRQVLLEGDTVYIRIDATENNVEVPAKYVEEGKIILNISPGAISDFNWVDDSMEFRAIFKRKIQNIKLPLKSVLWIYSNDTKIGYELNKP